MSVNLEGRETCPDCGLPIANQTEWDTIPEGKGDWLCWEQGGCGEGEGVADRLRERVAELTAERDEAVAKAEGLREIVATLQDYRDTLDSQRDELAAALEKMTNSAEAYMGYHAEKFYSGFSSRPTGLWPAIEQAKTALRLARGEGGDDEH